MNTVLVILAAVLRAILPALLEFLAENANEPKTRIIRPDDTTDLRERLLDRVHQAGGGDY